MTEIYLDYAATTPVIPQVIEAVTDCLKNDYGNPSSMHRLGIQAEKRIKDAKNQVSHLLNAAPDEIVFTSGGTESNNMAIPRCRYDKKRRGMHCITTVISTHQYYKLAHLEEQGYE